MNTALAIEIYAHQGCDDSALAAFVDESRRHFGDVRLTRIPTSVGGPLDVFFAIVCGGLAASAIYAKAFLETLGAEHAKTLNRRLFDVLNSELAKETWRGMFPLQLQAGSMWFHLQKPLSDYEFRHRVRLAAELIDQSYPKDSEPNEQAVDQSPRSYYWNEESSSWQLMPIGEYGPELPKDAG